jgi:hypothetical protein
MMVGMATTTTVFAEDGHWSQQMDLSTQQTAASTNRWQGNFPESSSTSTSNPWAGSTPSAGVVDEGHSFSVPAKKKQFPELDYSPYEEGRKKIQSRQSATVPGISQEAKKEQPRGNTLPAYQRPYYPAAPAYPYGGYSPWPYGGYGNYPWSGGAGPFPGGTPWGGTPWGGAPWGGTNNMPFFDGGSPWNGGVFPSNPFSW